MQAGWEPELPGVNLELDWWLARKLNWLEQIRSKLAGWMACCPGTKSYKLAQKRKLMESFSAGLLSGCKPRVVRLSLELARRGELTTSLLGTRSGGSKFEVNLELVTGRPGSRSG